jgi:FlaA1/EpsC-like NDP-sugar epimerase
MLNNYLRKTTFWLVLAADIFFLAVAHLAAYLIRFEGQLTVTEWSNIKTVLPLLLLFKITVFLFFGLYRGMWRYTGLTDLLNILKASALTTFIAMGCLLLVNRFIGFSRAVFLLDGILTFVAIAGIRVSFRLFLNKKQDLAAFAKDGSEPNRKKLLLIGAGDAAEKIIREVKDNRALPYKIIGLLDDNPRKIGQRIHGIPVLGEIGELHYLIAKVQPDEILIAIPSAGREQMNRIVELCRTGKVAYKTLPGLNEIINDQYSIRSMREVSYKDLLGRPPVSLELDRIEQVLENKTILVTGAGGSIGSELCRQIIRFKPKQLILFDASEHNLYQIEMEILHEIGFSNYVPVLGRIQEPELLKHVFRKYRPQVVFHAAAYKHVPMVENNPWEAVTNNIIATQRLIETAVRNRVERFILVSTDKAVRPTNVMGASKRMTEKIMQQYCQKIATETTSEARTRFMAVRFGNVLGSSGSVIPLFKKQIELGGPVTVTDPEMTRYFMSIEEAAQLILQAASMGEGGEIFILEMGTPIRIGQMARDLIRLCGREPDSEIAIKYIGLRPGEKLHEELITEGEGIVPTNHAKIMVLRRTGADELDLAEPLARLAELAEKLDAAGIKKLLGELMPDYSPRDIEAIL